MVRRDFYTDAEVDAMVDRSIDFPSQPGRTRRHEVASFRRSVRFVRGLDLPPAGIPDLRDRHAAESPGGDAWREPRRMYELDAMGAGSAPDLPFFDRGTWEMSVSLGRE